MIPLPAWIDPEAWAAFMEVRVKIKAPLTDYAAKLILRDLMRLKASGEDPQACLDQSIMLGWRGVFKVRDIGASCRAECEIWKPEPPPTPEQKAAADKARSEVMAKVMPHVRRA